MSEPITQIVSDVHWKLWVETGVFSALVSGAVSYFYWKHLAHSRWKNLLLLAYSEIVKAYERLVALYISLWPRKGKSPEYTKTSLFLFTNYSLLADLINSTEKADPDLFEALLSLRERFFHVSKQLESSSGKVHQLETLSIQEERTPHANLRGQIKAMTNEVAVLQQTAWAFVSEAPSVLVYPPTPRVGDVTFEMVTEKVTLIGERLMKKLPKSKQVRLLKKAFDKAFERKKEHDEYIRTHPDEVRPSLQSILEEFSDSGNSLPHMNLTKPSS